MHNGFSQLTSDDDTNEKILASLAHYNVVQNASGNLTLPNVHSVLKAFLLLDVAE